FRLAGTPPVRSPMRLIQVSAPRRALALMTVLALIAALIANVRLAAQQTGGFVGHVTDESGAALPGVTVTAASPVLQIKEASAVTDQNGEYRITELPIGTYEITYTLAGFQTVKKGGLRLTQAFTAQIDTMMKIGSLEETITVSGASPVVDVKAT